MAAVRQTVEHVESLEKYKHGFVTDIDQEFAPKGLNEDIVRFISAKKDEQERMLEWRLAVYEKLGIPLKEQAVLAGVEGAPRYAVDAVFDSVSVVTTFREELAKAGVIFLPMSEAVRVHPELVRKYLGTVVPVSACWRPLVMAIE